jgi:class 3 adenylate cyclase/tetratricopeptide (TPR) repeat protein
VEKERVQRRLAAILAADVAGYSRLTGADEEGTIARLRALRRELIDPTIASHGGRIVKTTGDGILIEFASVVDAVRCADEVQCAMVSRNADVPAERRIDFRVGINLGDVVVEGDDLLGDGVNVAARLETLAEPGGICLSSAAYEQVRDRLPLAFADMGERELKNIARPIRVFRVGADKESQQATPTSGAAPRQSIVVLPFANFSGDPQYDVFADALTENLTTDLCRDPDRVVIARSTAFTYKGKSVSVAQLGKDLGVRYVIQGAIQHGGGRLRINAQMIDAQTGAHIWAERFDKPQGNLLDMQEEITFHIARVVDVRLREVQFQRASQIQAGATDATDLAMQAWTIWLRGPSEGTNCAALTLFERAASIDDRNVNVLGGLCLMRAIRVMAGWSPTPEEDETYIVSTASRAIATNPAHPYAHLAKGYASWLQRKPAAAVLAFERLVALNPGVGMAQASLGFAKMCAGRFREGIDDVLNALRLSPSDPLVAEMCGYLGLGHICLGEYDDAINYMQKSVNLNPNMDYSHIWLAIAYAQAGRLVEAGQELTALQALRSDWTVKKFISTHARFAFPLTERVIAALRMAGLPDE